MRHISLAASRRRGPPDDAELLARGTDPLTGLLDRQTFMEVLERRTGDLPGRPPPFALLLLDLDHFAEVNRTHGRLLGDELLVALARRLRGEIRAADVAARFGGDSFAVLLPDPSAEEEANGMAARLLGVIGRPFLLGGRVIAPRCSIGIALCPADAGDHAALLDRASEALSLAKREGRGGRRRLSSPRHHPAYQGWHHRLF